MNLIVDHAGSRRSLPFDEGRNVLEVLQENGIDIKAPCGGIGKCGKCQVLVRDEEGLNYRLACTTPATDGLEVIIEQTGAMEAVESGIAESYPPDADRRGFGMALDLGTTTIAAHLHDLESGKRLASISRANPQASFGADVISRISASVDGKLDLMADVVQDAFRDMLGLLCEKAGVERSDVVQCAISGNTVMEHIACNLPPDTIGASPFTPLSLFGDEREIEGLPPTYFARCIAGYVGGDITAGMLARGIDTGGTRLFLDLGTNGEMALHHQGKIYCCATAAGPVFEGANIHFGMPALQGAISKVRFTGTDVEISVIGEGRPVGICGTGIIDAVAAMIDAGVVEPRGRLIDAEQADPALAHLLGQEDGVNVFYLTPDKSIYITQLDIRNVQLAKGAVAGGIQTMFQHAGIDCGSVETLEIAGGFGAFLNMKSAARIGLFPNELLGRASAVGNASAEGAAALLLSSQAHEREREIADKCSYIELSNSMEFNTFYVQMMEFDEAAQPLE